ncbi:NAD(P)/FAD-dependent oxidoreductase [Cupriavidus pauculus]|uniref:NAD(P)/FAD-dependent oxidoreductase n=1 Tax=Cupriavidus pauculus TaxID=82633 RepID=UPI0007834AB6|nr:FAD-dependent oxidoreductase [Cupriavidus pauculus]
MNPDRPTDATAGPTGETIAIVGAGQAGFWAAQTLRKEGFTGRLVLIGEELHPPHERPPLSKAVLAGEAAADSTWLISLDALQALNLEWWPDTRVFRIERERKRFVLDSGETLAYNKLILCTGGRARMLSVPGSDDASVYALRTIGDAQALAPMLKPGRSIVVIGGGWIGLEVAATARKRGAKVTVLEAQSRLCERTVPKEISEHLLALHLAHGVNIILGAEASSIARQADGRTQISLADGRALVCDAIVAGIGLEPNDELAKEAGLECDRGVIVDSRCQTSDSNIFAAGDVAVAPNPWAGRPIRLESWQNAQEQGIAAGRAALGLPVDYKPLPWFWSDQYDMNLQIYGVPAPSHRVVSRGAPETGSFVLFYLDGDVIQAALGANSAKDLRFAKRLIEQKKSVDIALLTDMNTPMSKI